MNTLDLVKDNKVMLAIVTKAEENGLQVEEADHGSVTVKTNCLPVKITWEMCSCHGGRMWLSQTNTNIYIELSSDEYDEENGIVDPQTELAYYIDNKMIETINGFEKYVYIVEVIGEYEKDRKKIHYFNSIEKASYFVFDEDGHDINSEYHLCSLEPYIVVEDNKTGVVYLETYSLPVGELVGDCIFK